MIKPGESLGEFQKRRNMNDWQIGDIVEGVGFFSISYGKIVSFSGGHCLVRIEKEFGPVFKNVGAHKLFNRSAHHRMNIENNQKSR